AIALDEYMTGYYISDIQEAIPKAAIQMAKKPLQAGIGVGTYDSPIRTLVNSFYGANHDNIYDLWFSIVDELMIKTKRRGFEDGHKTVADINKKDDPVEPLFTYKHQSFTICIGSAFVFSCLCVIVNQIIVNKRKNKRNLTTK
uniref:Uncharacterized protein n=1 Tax=Clytia hemisphaerica TaxID=252671 RepID=A0A7M6DPG0_9CNID